MNKFLRQVLIIILLFDSSLCHYIYSQNMVKVDEILSPPEFQNFGFAFGESIAVENDFLVVGQPGDNYSSEFINAGTAFLYQKDGDSWKEIAQLKASDAQDFNSFGSSVAMSGDNIVIGSTTKVYVFSKPQDGWESTSYETAVLTVEESDNLKLSLAIKNDVIVVGNVNKTSVSVFTMPTAGWKSTKESFKLSTSYNPPYYALGARVSIANNTIVVSSEYEFNEQSFSRGAVYVYSKPAAGWKNMIETARLKSGALNNTEYFGKSLSIYNENIVVGAYSYGEKKEVKAYIFTKPTDGWRDTVETAAFSNNDTLINYNTDVTLSEDYLAISNYRSGLIYVYKKSKTGNWISTNIPLGKISIDTQVNYSKHKITLSGNTLIAGIPNNSGGSYLSGSVHTYELPTGEWEDVDYEKERLNAPTTLAYHDNLFGRSIAVDGNYAVVGVPKGGRFRDGIAYVYYFNGTKWEQKAQLKPSQYIKNLDFGVSVDISGDDIVIGSLQQTYVFTKPETGWQNTTEQAQLHSTLENTHIYNQSIVKIEKDVILVSAPYANEPNDTLAFIYIKPEKGWETAIETSVLKCSKPSKQYYNLITSYYNIPNWHSSFIDMSENMIAIGVRSDSLKGSVYAYEKPETGWGQNMYETAEFLSIDTNVTTFGEAVAVNENEIAVTKYFKTSDTTNNEVYIYSTSDQDWSKNTTPSAILELTHHVNSISLSHNKLAIGCSSNNAAISPGSIVYLYHKPTTGWNSSQNEDVKLKPSNSSNYNGFGRSISLSGRHLIVNELPYNVTIPFTPLITHERASVHFYYENTPPTCTNVSIDGNLMVSNTIVGKYVYDDIDGDTESSSIYRWYRSDDAIGTNKIFITEQSVANYKLSHEDAGKFISLQVTPHDGFEEGLPVESALVGPVIYGPTIKVASINRHYPSEMNVDEDSVVFSVFFDRNVIDVSKSDFKLSGEGVGNAVMKEVILISPTIYHVVVTGISTLFTGELNLDIKETNQIKEPFYFGSSLVSTTPQDEEYYIVNVLSSIQDNVAHEISISPNPFENQINITTGEGIEIENIQVLDLVGKTVYEGTHTTQLLSSNLPKGTYIVKVMTNKGIVTQNIIKQ